MSPRLLTTTKAGQKRLMWQALQTLWAYYKQDLGKGEQYVQAHVPVAIGRLPAEGRAQRGLGLAWRDRDGYDRSGF